MVWWDCLMTNNWWCGCWDEWRGSNWLNQPLLLFGKTSQELRMLSSVALKLSGKQWLAWIQVLNCQNYNQCLKCHKSPGLSFQLSKWRKKWSKLSKKFSIVKIVKTNSQLSELSKLSTIVENCQKMSKNCQNCQKLSRWLKIVEIVKNCQDG